MIQLVTVDNEDLAYHYASANIDEVFNQEKEFNELTKNISLSFSSHILATEEASFDSLCKKDPYFKQFTSYQNLAFFMEKVKEKSLLTDEEVAGYLRTQFNLCILQVKSAEKCNDFLHSLAAHFLFYLVI
ncbi:hypothetical protein N4627_05270 [Limosilactobacillus vaginalis]|uniref:hypothetical protein n=2 Tax=Limosilactobacillus vaginalis TaxID=1633 RepID=UPI0021B5DD1D|nr:hypothetical protein [Limosilactobacillus vaginalis]UXC68516.1 hypothetical protein N4627_05270 [Limosilactobacillus vaginalis]